MKNVRTFFSNLLGNQNFYIAVFGLILLTGGLYILQYLNIDVLGIITKIGMVSWMIIKFIVSLITAIILWILGAVIMILYYIGIYKLDKKLDKSRVFSPWLVNTFGFILTFVLAGIINITLVQLIINNFRDWTFVWIYTLGRDYQIEFWSNAWFWYYTAVNLVVWFFGAIAYSAPTD